MNRLERHFLLLILMMSALCDCCFSASDLPILYRIYVGTYSEHGGKGIYFYDFDPASGKLTERGIAIESPDPSFLAVSPNGRFIYAVNELDTFQNKETGAISAFSIDKAAGTLSLLNQVSSRDEGPAHIAIDRTGKWAFVANYTRGSVAVFPIFEDGRVGEASAFVQHHGSSVNPERQKGPHAHSVTISPNDRFVIVADLGLDELIVYPFNKEKGTLGKPHDVKVDAGSGPRHSAFDSTGKFLYLLNELKSTVAVYRFHEGRGELTHVQTISALPQGFANPDGAAEIAVHPSGKYLYASTRSNDAIAIFAINKAKGTLEHLGFVPTQGRTPRHFSIDPTGNWLLAENQDSDNIVVFRIDQATGHLSAVGEPLHVPSPACVVFVER